MYCCKNKSNSHFLINFLVIEVITSQVAYLSIYGDQSWITDIVLEVRLRDTQILPEHLDCFEGLPVLTV